MQRVASRLRDDVDDATDRPAVLRLEAARLDLELLDGLVVECLSLDSQHDVGRADAVDRPLALGGGRSVDRKRDRSPLRGAVVRHDARVILGNVGVVAIDRHMDDDVATVTDRGRGARRVYEWRFSRDENALALSELQNHPDRRGDVDADGDRLFHARKTGKARSNDISAGWQRRQPVRSVLCGHRCAPSLQVGPDDGDRDSRNGRAEGVGDPARDPTGRLGSCRAAD